MAKIQNVVATANIGCRLPLIELVDQLPNAIYNPCKFKAIIWRITTPKTTILLFGSGKIVITGAKSEAESFNIGELVTSTLSQLGLPV